jgi:hypothetical protein
VGANTGPWFFHCWNQMGGVLLRQTVIELHPNNANREVGFCLSKSWEPLISSL